MDRGIPCVRGNHERWALARGAHVATRGLLPHTEVQRVWLRAHPSSLLVAVDGASVAVHHGWPSSDMDGLREDTPRSVLDAHVDRCGAAVLVVGQTHRAFVRAVGDRLVVNVGRLGAPRPGDVPTFGVIDAAARKATIVTLPSESVVHLQERRAGADDV